MMSDTADDVLRGLTTKVYRLLLSEGEPLSIRAVQKKLGLSSPSLAAYHLTKLEDVGLIKQTARGYVADKVLLGDMVRLKSTFVPRFIFYAFFFLSVLVLELTVYKQTKLSGEYIFHVLVSLFATLFFFYETARIWSKERARKDRTITTSLT
jgi:predicted transcriptional regulator